MVSLSQVVGLDRACTGGKVGIIDAAFEVSDSNSSIITGKFKNNRARSCIASVSNGTFVTIHNTIDNCGRSNCIYVPTE
jgi:hypothetical protein